MMDLGNFRFVRWVREGGGRCGILGELGRNVDWGVDDD